MCKKKLVLKRNLIEFYNELIKIYSNGSKVEINLLPLIEYYEKYILQQDQDKLNELKRKVYLDMRYTTDKQKNEKLYELYQMLKSVN